jgi:sugar phosphate isomerase/epimerase
MRAISRRRFLDAGVAGLGAIAGARRLGAAPLGLPVGCQTYPVREQLGSDPDGTLRELAAEGYETIEFCSPPSYRGGYERFVDMAAADLVAMVKRTGLTLTSCHYQFQELKEHMAERVAYASELGLKHMVISSFGLRRAAGMDDWRRAAEEANPLGEQAQKAGMQLGFHNHGTEFTEIGGVLIFDELMRRFDRKLVKSQFQVSVVSQGFDPAEVVAKYPGRFLSLHLQDWSAETRRQTAVGQGAIDWKKLFTAAKAGGIEYYYVEMNMDLMKASAPYLKALEV